MGNRVRTQNYQSIYVLVGGEKMHKGWFLLLLGITTLMMFPYQVQGEELTNEKRGILSESINRLLETTDTVTEEVNSSLNTTLPIEEIKEVIPVVEPVEGLVKEVTDKTNTVVEHVVKKVPPTTESIVSEVMGVVDETVEIIPEVPIVTPLLTEVSESVKKVTNIVDETVEHGSETVLVVIDKKDEPVPEEKNPISMQQQGKLEEPSMAVPIVQKEEDKIPQQSTSPNAPTNELEVVPDEKVSSQESRLTKEKRVMEEKESLQLNQNSRLKGKEHKKVGKKSIDKSPTVLPPIPDKQNKEVIVTAIVTTSTSSPSSSSTSVIAQGGDTLVALLPSQEAMKELIRKKWYHKNHYAIIQWIHTPLRKPPEVTPFYS